MKKLKEEVNSLKQEEICPKLAVIMAISKAPCKGKSFCKYIKFNKNKS